MRKGGIIVVTRNKRDESYAECFERAMREFLQEFADSDAVDDTPYYELDDYTYDEEVGECFASDLLSIINDVLSSSNIVCEDFTSKLNLIKHFNKHCIGKNTGKKSTRRQVLYDFKDKSQYAEYEKKISERIKVSDNTIGSLYDYESNLKCLRNLFKGNTEIVFCNSCGIKSNGELVTMAILAFSSNVTKNYKSENTVDICVQNKSHKTVSLYPVDANYLQAAFNKLIKKYAQYSGEEYAFNND